MALRRLVQSGDVEQIEEVARELRRAREALTDARSKITQLESQNSALKTKLIETENAWKKKKELKTT
jgi:septal ring factor EnvC (AmiA/AmiB activator)